MGAVEEWEFTIWCVEDDLDSDVETEDLTNPSDMDWDQ